MSLNKANSRRKMCETAMKAWIIDLVKLSEERNGDSKYLSDLVDSLTMAAHILKNVPIQLWDDESGR